MRATVIFAGFLALVASAPVSHLAPRGQQGGVLDESSPEELSGSRGRALGVTDTSVYLLGVTSGVKNTDPL